ncbi:dynein intermediate chain 2, ciliary-like [Scaptodrosophila lebanonensis]|uniref:Dynein intermediate chain 2, ciliary-like n=1 Tax=Drosophila lebanonensis TaxID=7225 RepID=A0A6J2THD3_DROLE|nr:dynein intermediate chain 2, ciliary-like [Scaptodrosophila lebanonensis]
MADKKSKGDGKQNKQQKRGSKVKTEGGGDADDFDAWMKSRQLVKPDDQLELTEAELSEEITKVLTPTNTNIVRNLVIYSFKEGEYVPAPLPGNTVTLLSFSGNSLHVDSEEARRQIEESDEIGYPLPMPKFSVIELRESEAVDAEEGQEEGEDEDRRSEGKLGQEEQDSEGEEEEDEGKTAEGDGAEGEEGPAEAAADDEEPTEQMRMAAPAGKKRKLINQFNYCERAALTFSYPKRNVDTQTIPPPRSQYGSNVLQWVIYDTYLADFEEQQKDQSTKHTDRKRSLRQKKFKDKSALAEQLNRKYLKCWQILERMIIQNIFNDIAHDYRYWEDPADEFREGEGNMLPLWKFQYEKTKKMCVTDILFNPSYYDLFAVCFGSHDFTKQLDEGYLCLFTVKNPSFPDYIIQTDCGVMCCDIHPHFPFLVVVGLYDGNVAVYNLRENYRTPLYLSRGNNCKHEELVWQIKWGPDMTDGEINFFSVSSDGRVLYWILQQNMLWVTTLITLYLENGLVDGPDGTKVHLKSCGCCIKFHPVEPKIFLIGTEEGLIYKCSTTFNSKYLMTYEAHNLSVYSIDFNRFNSDIFVSCSGDWRVKVWEDMRAEPLFIFDLGSAVGDVKWAPYSSTVFAAVTTEGKVHVFDLNVDKYKAICIQAVVPKRKNKLTRLAFNEKLPFIIVGDEKGVTTSLKLSPNLRMMVKPPKKQLYLDQNTLQISKLEKLLSLVRETPGETTPSTMGA